MGGALAENMAQRGIGQGLKRTSFGGWPQPSGQTPGQQTPTQPAPYQPPPVPPVPNIQPMPPSYWQNQGLTGQPAQPQPQPQAPQTDLQRSIWALKQGQPQAAEGFARSAAGLQPQAQQAPPPQKAGYGGYATGSYGMGQPQPRPHPGPMPRQPGCYAEQKGGVYDPATGGYRMPAGGYMDHMGMPQGMGTAPSGRPPVGPGPYGGHGTPALPGYSPEQWQAMNERAAQRNLYGGGGTFK